MADAIENANLLVATLGEVHASPDEIVHEDAFRQRSVVFAMVRHPLTWYQSMWAHRMDEKWAPIDEWFSPRWINIWADFTEYCRASTFSEFIRKCTSRYPGGYVSMLYDAYTEGCTFIGKQEQLAEDLLEALKMAGEQFHVERICKTSSKNVRAHSSRWLPHCKYTPELVDYVIEAEMKAIKKFGYKELPKDIL